MNHKPILVILPGWGGSCATWQSFIQLAEKDFAVHCIDLPCFGNEPCPSEVWGVEEYAEFVKQKLSIVNCQLSNVTILGHSFGGQVAVCLAAKHPDLIDKLILSGAAVVRPNRIIKRTISQGVAAFGQVVMRLPWLRHHEDAVKKVFYRLIGSPDYLETLGVKREIYKKIIRQDGTHLLPQIQAPTLIVWGARDRMTPLRHGRKIFRLIPRAKWHMFKDAGHGLHHEVMKELLDVIRPFSEL